MRTLLLIAFLLIGVHALAQYTPATVPNTKLVNNSYVSNPDNIISESTVSQINDLLSSLEQQTTAQVAVVVLDSIGEADIFDFSQELFNTWGIGGSNDNGLLILFAQDQRTVRFHTGYKLEGPLPDVVCKQIQTSKMVPYFKEGNYDAGLLFGVKEVYNILTDPNYSIEITNTEPGYSDANTDYWAFVIFMVMFIGIPFLVVWATTIGRFSNSKAPVQTEYPQMRMKRSTWLWEFGGIPLIILLLFWVSPWPGAQGDALLSIYLYYMGTLFHRIWRERKMIKEFVEKRKFFEATEYFRDTQWYWILIAFVFPLPFLFYLPVHFARKRFYRNHSRTCKLCDQKMIKLSEKEDDAHLTKNQQMEESIGSIDYDIWKCTSCNAIESWRFPSKFSKYKECNTCKTKAVYLHSDRTLVSATYTSSGQGERTFKCKACGKSRTESYTIAMKTSSSSSSGSSGFSSSGSSGGSWGGGRSGGGGSSSSW